MLSAALRKSGSGQQPPDEAVTFGAGGNWSLVGVTHGRERGVMGSLCDKGATANKKDGTDTEGKEFVLPVSMV